MSALISVLIENAAKRGASDLHLEAGLPPAMRIRGELSISGDPLHGNDLLQAAREIAGVELWESFNEKRSIDLSQQIYGVRCRINIFQTFRGVGFAVRILSSHSPSLHSLNLHPSLSKLAQFNHGLVLLCGPTGSGKSSTIAALVREINMSQAAHIITIEHPIEYELVPQRSFIRQREVGRDSPSFEQALLDSLREDPDVIVVGEMRQPETMKLTLSAAETGHLVFSTVHSATVTEALQRVVSSVHPQAQDNVCAQLADCLTAVVCQRLVWNEKAGIRVPECEILYGTKAVRSCIRQNNLYRLAALIETGGADDMWNLNRYRRWLAEKQSFVIPTLPVSHHASLGQEKTTALTRKPLYRKSSSEKKKEITSVQKTSSSASGIVDLDSALEDPKDIIAQYLRHNKNRK